MEKRYLWIGVSVIIVITALILRVMGTGDRWVCVESNWVKRGNPTEAMPTGTCDDEWSLANELKALSALLGKQPPENPITPVPDQNGTSTATSTDSEKPSVMVELISPSADGLLTSPYQVKGRAHGSWFFEAVLPVVLTTEDGRVLAQTYGTAVGDWMVDGWVDFTSNLQFDATGVERGYLIIKKDNPSGLPEYDAQVSFPVRLAN